jgi:four helix bundle protein
MTSEQLADRLLDFAARVGNVVDALPDTRLGRHIAGQLVRCGTAAAPNYEEGCGAESRADFIHKLRVGLCNIIGKSIVTARSKTNKKK